MQCLCLWGNSCDIFYFSIVCLNKIIILSYKYFSDHGNICHTHSTPEFLQHVCVVSSPSAIFSRNIGTSILRFESSC